MLYVDQPNMSGYSYDEAADGSVDMLTGLITQGEDLPEANLTTLPGTFSIQNPRSTANTTTNSARDMWHFVQTFVAEYAFPQASFMYIMDP